MADAQKELTISSLVLIVILILYTISAPLFHKYKFHYIHETGICMMVGVLVTFVASIIVPEVYLYITHSLYRQT